MKAYAFIGFCIFPLSIRTYRTSERPVYAGAALCTSVTIAITEHYGAHFWLRCARHPPTYTATPARVTGRCSHKI